MRATDAVIDRKRALVCSHCDVGESCTFNHCDSGDRVFVIPPAVIPEFVKPNSVTSVPLLSCVKVTGSAIDNHEVLVRIRPVDSRQSLDG